MSPKSKKKNYRHKSHFCIFCKMEIPRIYEHFLKKHPTEEKVREIQATEDKRERLWRRKRLIQEGDNFYNSQSNEKSGERKTVKVSPEESAKKKYFDCENCMGRLRTIYRAQHMRTCKAVLVKPTPEEPEQDKQTDAFNGVPEVLINRIRKSLYLNSFINHMSEVKDNKKVIRIMVRDTVRLEEEMQKVTEEKKPLISFLKNDYVDDFIETIKLLCKETKMDKEQIFVYPFRAERLCRLIKNLCKFLIPYFSEKNLEKDVADVTEFQKIFISDCEKLIKEPVYKSVVIKRLKNPKKLPKTSDIHTLAEKLKKDTSHLISKLLVKKDPTAWRNLAENMLCRLTIFNRRKGGAIEKMTVEQYTSTEVRSKATTKEALFGLNKEDKKFLKKVRVVEIIHKGNNIVPVFINKEQESVMDLLLKFRDCAKINKNNKYFFAAGRNSLHPFSGGRVLEKYREIFPEGVRQLFTASNLRKHGATTAHLLNLDFENKEEWTYYMGQSVAACGKYHRTRQQVNGILKTGRILTALDEGILVT